MPDAGWSLAQPLLPPGAGRRRHQLVHHREPLPRGSTIPRSRSWRCGAWTTSTAGGRASIPGPASCRPHPWGKDAVTRDLILPSGWMKRFPRLGMRPIARAIRTLLAPVVSRGQARAGADLSALPLPARSARSRRQPLLQHRRLFALLAAACRDEVRSLERELVLRTDATVCVARYRADELRAAVPEAAEARSTTFPTARRAAFLADEPQHRPAAAARRHRPPASPAAGLHRLDRGPRRLAADEAIERGLSRGVDRHRGR